MAFGLSHTLVPGMQKLQVLSVETPELSKIPSVKCWVLDCTAWNQRCHEPETWTVLILVVCTIIIWWRWEQQYNCPVVTSAFLFPRHECDFIYQFSQKLSRHKLHLHPWCGRNHVVEKDARWLHFTLMVWHKKGKLLQSILRSAILKSTQVFLGLWLQCSLACGVLLRGKPFPVQS